MKRIIVIGSGGAGKSTFSRRLSKCLNINSVHLDVHFWHAGWIETEQSIWKEKVKDLVKADSWIIDGNFGSTLDIRLDACDTVIFLDMPRFLCMWRIVKRFFMYRKRTRPDLAEGCFEKIDLEFIKWVWNFKNNGRLRILEKLENYSRAKRVVHLKSRKEVESFFEKIKAD